MSLKYPGLARFRGDFIRMTNHQRPITSVIDTIRYLKTSGYKLYILSNIGKETFDELCIMYPELNECFEGAFTATAENDYLQKPDPAFYEAFKKFMSNEGHAGKQILFIDDLKKNIAAAAKCNIAGLHFTSPKRLARALNKLDIL